MHRIRAKIRSEPVIAARVTAEIFVNCKKSSLKAQFFLAEILYICIDCICDLLFHAPRQGRIQGGYLPPAKGD